MDDSLAMARSHGRPNKRLVTGLLACGIAVAVVQIAGDVIAAALYPGYSYADQTVSELSAIGAPTRPFLTGVGMVFVALVFTFASGVWLVAEGRRNLRVCAALLGVFALNGLLWALFPMQQRGSEMAATDVAHVIGAIVQVITIVLFIAFGSGADGRWFRIFSLGLGLAILVAGALAGTQAGRIAAGEPTPFIGLVERVSFYGPSIWTLVLAIELIRQRSQLLGSGKAPPQNSA